MNDFRIPYFGTLIALVIALASNTYQGITNQPKFPPSTKVYIDSMVDVGDVVEFNPRTQMLIKMWDGNKERYIKIVEKDDVYEY